MIRPFSACHLNHAQADFQNIFDVSYSDLCSKISESTDSSSGEQCFFLYEINTANTHLSGIVGCIDNLTNTMSKLLPHEKVNDQRYQRYALQIEEYGDSICPILLIVEESFTFDKLLNDNRLRDINLFHIESNSEMHSLYKIKSTILSNEIVRQLNDSESFLIADGHHRISALNVLKKKHPNDRFPILAMVVSSSDIQIRNFNRLLTFDDQDALDRFLTIIENNFQKNDHNLSKDNFSLRITVHNNLYYFKSETDVATTHQQIDKIIETCPHSSVQQVTLESGNKTSNYNSCEMLIELPALGFQDVKNEASKGRLFPVNTTCFHPKPIPGIIAVRKQDFYLSDIDLSQSNTLVDYKEYPILI